MDNVTYCLLMLMLLLLLLTSMPLLLFVVIVGGYIVLVDVVAALELTRHPFPYNFLLQPYFLFCGTNYYTRIRGSLPARERGVSQE